ncbi:MAG: sigma 54-interacting transcriptional regulator, partial [Deltaproteobacteria bacterium]|nr:sigma 54-interacting transcriptional regulator [Deltaproteobacteria bacterium]
EKAGLVEVADGGTIFLDEIGDMPLSMQVKLLRVIQEREFLRVGGVDPISVDVRFIAATHRDLKEDVEKGHFRQDLYYRLNVISIHVPPLAERNGDVPLLAHYFLARKSQEMKRDIQEIDREVMDLLDKYSWPGNVRELEMIFQNTSATSPLRHTVNILPEYPPLKNRKRSISGGCLASVMGTEPRQQR